MGWVFSWAVDVPLDHGQLYQMVLQNHKDWDKAAGTDKNAPEME